MTPDPTKQEMVEFIRGQFGDEPEDFDVEEAIYWFASAWHSGQWSNLYSVLSTSQYHPGLCSNGPEPDSMGDMILRTLEDEYA
jgi:hypothetical protein